MESKLIEQAAEHYKEYGRDIGEILRWHHENGFVINIPDLIAFGYFHDDGGEKVAHISYVRGDMRLLVLISANYVIDKIEFERNFSGRIKRYDIRKFENLIK